MAKATWQIDNVHSSVGFWVRHMVVSKVHGRFTKWDGSFAFDPDNPTDASVQVTIDASSVDTHEPKRDDHLRSADFFDVAQHPAITFASTAVADAGEGQLKLTGDLTIRGTKKTVVFDVEYSGRVQDPWGGERVGFAAKTVIDRRDFGLTFNQVLAAGGVLVGERVEIALEVEAVRAVEAAA